MVNLTNSFCTIFTLKPFVGDIVFMLSFAKHFKIEVLPALSNPSNNILHSFFIFFFLENRLPLFK